MKTNLWAYDSYSYSVYDNQALDFWNHNEVYKYILVSLWLKKSWIELTVIAASRSFF